MKGNEVSYLPCKCNKEMEVPSAAVFLAEEEGIDSFMNGKEKVSTHTTLLSPHLIKLGEFK